MDRWTLSALESYSSSAGIMINFNQWECHWKNTRERKTLYQPSYLQYEVTNYKCNRSGGICTIFGKCVGVRVPSAGVIGNTPVTGVTELSNDTRTSTRAAWAKANNKLLFNVMSGVNLRNKNIQRWISGKNVGPKKSWRESLNSNLLIRLD